MTKLIQELLALSESGNIDEKNLKAIEQVLKFDGDIPLHTDRRKDGEEQSSNQADKLATEDGMSMFYVSLNEPHGDCEAYVVVDKKGEVSYYDFTHHTAVLKGKFIPDSHGSKWEEAVNEVVDEYAIEGGPNHIKKGACEAFLNMLASDPYSK